jgi:hypothetical protein
VQVHGGMGFIEDAGAAQHFRDSRILPIYEGTNGIQANDLVFRKVLRDGGSTLAAFTEQVRTTAQSLETAKDDRLARFRPRLLEACDALDEATKWLLDNGRDAEKVAAGAYPYLNLVATVAGGWMMARTGLAALDLDAGDFREAKLETVKFFGQHVLPRARGFVIPVTEGFDATLGLPEDSF